MATSSAARPATAISKWRSSCSFERAGSEPDARLLFVESETGVSHRVLELWGRSELGGIESNIAVRGVRSDRKVAFARVHVDRLCAHQDQRRAMVAEGFERIEQNASCGDVLGIRSARHFRFLPSNGGAARPQKGLFQDS